MKNIELYIWSRSGRFDGDGYETDFEVSDNIYERIIALLKEYNSEFEDEEWECDDSMCEKEFTEDFLAEQAPDIYKLLEEMTTEEILEGLKENLEEDFDEEEEGCTLDEYIRDNYYWGFWINSI